jgi:DNA polymerase III delta prime subunit
MDETTKIEPGKQAFKMIGYVAHEFDVVITQNKNMLMLKLATRTDYPEYIDPNDLPNLVNLFVENNDSLHYHDDLDLSDDERRARAWDYFKNQWFMFTPSVTFDETRKTPLVAAFSAQEMPMNDDIDLDDVKFLRIPEFKHLIGRQSQQPLTRPMFEAALVNGEPLGGIYPWPDDREEAPQAIIWCDQDDVQYLYTGIRYQKKITHEYAFFNDGTTPFKRVKLTLEDEDWFTNLLQFNGTRITFVPVDIFMKYANQANEFTVSNVPQPDAIVQQDINEKTMPKSQTVANAVTQPNPEQNQQQVKFLDRFVTETEKNGLHYDIKDLVNFHAAMESKGMVILSGLSGTGKTQLVNAYARTLGIGISETNPAGSQLCFIPVRPFWADDSDLLGYADMVNNVYRPGDSGLVDTLIQASKKANADRLYIVVFDEMNLARVEHYFSQFLSVLEMPSDKRVVQLYNPQLANRLYNSETYPSRVAIHDNVLFVGTVNTDESTFQFSDKVLDRSNVIALHIRPFNVDYESIVDSDAENNRVSENEISKLNYFNLVNREDQVPLNTREKTLLWDLHLALNQVDQNFGIGWRVVSHIDSFVRHLPTYPDGVTRAEAMDLQLVQRVLTKVRGSEGQLRTLLAGQDTPGELAKILDEYKDISEFTESRKVLAQKSRELKLYGFTM